MIFKLAGKTAHRKITFKHTKRNSRNIPIWHIYNSCDQYCKAREH